jgi:hypothetical protein
MASSDHLNPYQMSLFLQAKDFMGLTAGHQEDGDYGDYRLLKDSPKLNARKLRESKTGAASSTFQDAPKGRDTLYESIKKEGVTSPVSLWVTPEDDGWKTMINDGHHRIAAANDINPEMFIPVTYR